MPGRELRAAPVLGKNPFTLGVASDFKAELTRSHAQFDLRFVTSVERPNGTGYPERSWIVMDGKPGASMA